jgi:transcriptional regulator
MSTKIKQKEIEYRRAKIIELKACGLSQTEIAKQLQVSDASVCLDLQYLREQAKSSIKNYITEILPLQYEVCLHALDSILKHTSDVIQTTDDEHIKLSSLSLYKEVHLEKIQLLSDVNSIDQAISIIKSKQSEQSLTPSQQQQEQQELELEQHPQQQQEEQIT